MAVIYSYRLYGTFECVLPMLLRNDRGPFSSRADVIFFFPKYSFESHSTASIESVKWKYWYEEIICG